MPKTNNVACIIEQRHQSVPNQLALIFKERHITYQALNDMASQVANVLSNLGVELRDRVALLLPNTPEFVAAYFGILKCGAIAVSINPNLKADEVRNILKDCTPKIVISTQKLIENFKVGESQAPILGSFKYKSIDLTELSRLMSEASSSFYAVDVEAQSPAAILYTSGTTGLPKGVTLAHSTIVFSSLTHNRCFGITSSDRLLLYSPLSHTFGQNAVLNSGLAAGATIILESDFVPKQSLDLIVAERVTMLLGTPMFYKLLLSEDLSRYDLSLVRYCFSGAAPLPQEVVQQWKKACGLVIYEGYGSTEAVPCALYPHGSSYQINSVGRVVDDVTIKVVQPNGTEAPVGEVGELLVRGPNIMLGYWDKPEETTQVIQNGWFHTGDIGRVSEDGYLYLVDRLKDMINVGGLKVYPTEVEKVLSQHPAVDEVAVYGVPDPVRGEIVQANIRLKSQQVAIETDLVSYCAQHLASYKVPRVINFVKVIPKNASSKILRNQLRQEAIDNGLNKHNHGLQQTSEFSKNSTLWSIESVVQAQPEEGQAMITTHLKSLVASILNISPLQVDIQIPLKDIGIDSFSSLELQKLIEKSLNIYLDTAIMFDKPTIEELAHYLFKKLVSFKLSKDVQDLEQNKWAERPVRCLIKLQQGSKIPFFCVPGVNGTVNYLTSLASAMGKEQTFYGLQAVGIEGDSSPLNQIEEIATLYLNEIKQVYPKGPYLLGGNCFGSVVAFEMAHQLQRDGQEVPLLVLIDGFPSIADSNMAKNFGNREYYQTFIAGLIDRFGSSAVRSSGENSDEVFNRLVNVLLSSHQATSRYKPQKLDSTRIVLFRATETNQRDIDSWISLSLYKDPSWGWGQLSTQDIEVYFVPGDHIQMMLYPHVWQMGKKLRLLLSDYQSQTSTKLDIGKTELLQGNIRYSPEQKLSNISKIVP